MRTMLNTLMNTPRMHDLLPGAAFRERGGVFACRTRGRS